MKRLIFGLLLALAIPVHAEWYTQGKQVLLDETYFTQIDPSTNTLQSIMEWIDLHVGFANTNSFYTTNQLAQLFYTQVQTTNLFYSKTALASLYYNKVESTNLFATKAEMNSSNTVQDVYSAANYESIVGAQNTYVRFTEASETRTISNTITTARLRAQTAEMAPTAENDFNPVARFGNGTYLTFLFATGTYSVVNYDLAIHGFSGIDQVFLASVGSTNQEFSPHTTNQPAVFQLRPDDPSIGEYGAATVFGCPAPVTFFNMAFSVDPAAADFAIWTNSPATCLVRVNDGARRVSFYNCYFRGRGMANVGVLDTSGGSLYFRNCVFEGIRMAAVSTHVGGTITLSQCISTNGVLPYVARIWNGGVVYCDPITAQLGTNALITESTFGVMFTNEVVLP